MRIRIALPEVVTDDDYLPIEQEFPITLEGRKIGRALLADVDTGESGLVLDLDVEWDRDCPAVVAQGGMEAFSVAVDGHGRVRGEVLQ